MLLIIISLSLCCHSLKIVCEAINLKWIMKILMCLLFIFTDAHLFLVILFSDIARYCIY